MDNFSIYSCWKTRIESADAIAQRLVKLITQLRPIAEPLRRWYQVITEDNIPELGVRDWWLKGAVASRINKDELGAPVPNGGYHLVTMTAHPTHVPQTNQVHLDIFAGGTYVNNANLHSMRDQPMDDVLLNYSVFKQLVLAISDAFEPNWCRAAPFSLRKDFEASDYKEGPVIAPCWMIHLSPPLGGQITPPSDIVSERFADGSLFMSATDQTFDPKNSEHVAAAHRLFAVLDTLQEKRPPGQWRR